jgi:hypothetical protein
VFTTAQYKFYSSQDKPSSTLAINLKQNFDSSLEQREEGKTDEVRKSNLAKKMKILNFILGSPIASPC